MSTMSTQLNLGASYIVNDFYHRFLRPGASNKELVAVARISTVFTIILGSGLGLLLTSAGQAFSLLLMIGAGTGLIYILRWFWWRINGYTEIVAMISSLLIAFYLNFGELQVADWSKIIVGAVSTTLIWLVATFLTPPDDQETLQNFVDKVNPGGPGWKRYSSKMNAEPWIVPKGMFSMFLGCTAVYGFLLSTGQFIYGNMEIGFFLFQCLLFLVFIKFGNKHSR